MSVEVVYGLGFFLRVVRFLVRFFLPFLLALLFAARYHRRDFSYGWGVLYRVICVLVRPRDCGFCLGSPEFLRVVFVKGLGLLLPLLEDLSFIAELHSASLLASNKRI